MFNFFGKFRKDPLEFPELERFKELTAIPGVLDALTSYNLGITSVSPLIGFEVQECVHLSNAITSRSGVTSDTLFEIARSGRWHSIEQRLSIYQGLLEDAGKKADSELEAIIFWAKKNNLPDLTPSEAGFYKTTGIPKSKRQLMALRFIHLPNAGIREIPAELSVLPNVQGICFDDNEIHELPDSICKMQTVSMLHLENNFIERIPEAIGNMASLTLIDLDGNNISRLPRSLLQLRNLRKLRLRGQRYGIDMRYNASPLDDASHSVLAQLSMNPELDVSV